MSHNFLCDSAINYIKNFTHISLINDRKVFSPNCGGVAQLQAELHLLKVENLDVYKTLFANPDAYVRMFTYTHKTVSKHRYKSRPSNSPALRG